MGKTKEIFGFGYVFCCLLVGWLFDNVAPFWISSGWRKRVFFGHFFRTSWPAFPVVFLLPKKVIHQVGNRLWGTNLRPFWSYKCLNQAPWLIESLFCRCVVMAKPISQQLGCEFFGEMVMWQTHTTPPKKDWLVVSNIFYFQPYLGKIPILANIFQLGWNHHLEELGKTGILAY